MTINITDNGNSITVTYTDSDDNTASAVVVGESLSAVKDRRQEIVDNHNLKKQATER